MSSESISSDCEDNEQSVGLINSTPRTMEARAEHLKTRNYMTFYSIATAFGVGAVVMTLVWVVKYRGGFAWNEDPQHQFNWHPLLMVLAMIFLFGQSALVYRTARRYPKKKLKLFHAAIHFLIVILVLIALKCSYDSHVYAKPPKPNLYTMHSWIGLLTALVFLGQYFVGFGCFLYPGIARTLRHDLLPLHAATGVAAFILALLCVATGLTEKIIWTLADEYSNFGSEALLANFICLFIVIYGLLSLYLVTNPDFKRTNLPEEEIVLGHAQTE